MGDRTDCSIRTRKKDFKLFRKHLLAEKPDIASEENGVIGLELSEVNYGGQDALTSIAAEGGLFFGSHGEGGDYSSHRFYGADGHYADIPCTREGSCFVTLNDDGEVDCEGEWERVKQFLVKESEVRRRLYSRKKPKRD